MKLKCTSYPTICSYLLFQRRNNVGLKEEVLMAYSILVIIVIGKVDT